MKNQNEPAMPIEFSGFGQCEPQAFIGFTKREQLLKDFMVAMLTGATECYGGKNGAQNLARDAMKYVDAYFEELEESGEFEK